MYHYVGVRFVKSEQSKKPESKIYIYNYDANNTPELFVGERYKILSENGYNYNNAIVEICSLYSFENEVPSIAGLLIKKISAFLYVGLNPSCMERSELYHKFKKSLCFSLEEFYALGDKPILFCGRSYRDIKEVLDDLSFSNYIGEKDIVDYKCDSKREEYANINCTSLNYVTTSYRSFENVNNEKENKTMNIFGNLDFGQYKGSDIKLSMKGLAYKTNENTYVAYDEVEKNLTNVTDFIIDINNMIFMLPVALKDVMTGDIINHNKEFVIVTEVNSDSNSITAISPKNKEIKIIMPERNIFGFDFVSKLFCPISANIFGTMDKDNPFGTMLPFLMMKEGNFDMKSLMLAQMMTNGGSIDFQNNPMMLYFLMEDKNNEMNNSLPYLMMMGNMANNSN